MSKIQIKDIFRYSRPYNSENEIIDGYKNHFSSTNLVGQKMVLLEKGINQIAEINAIDGKRKPAIVIRSSPHKIGSETTPWQDVFDIDNGYIRYYGDNKIPGNDPSTSQGNKILLEAFDVYNNSDKRHLSVPLLFYKAVSRNNNPKGYIEFNGFGIIKGVELVTQYDRSLNRTFSNFAFNFHVFSLTENNEKFDWDWINARRDSMLTLKQTLEKAPRSWQNWIKNGNSVLEKCRRRVSNLLVISKAEQIPHKGSQEEKILREIYLHYQHKKAMFEGLASSVVKKLFENSTGSYFEGWITPPSSDGGADFYGRIEIGEGFGKAKLIVLGQAKCESQNTPTSGNHIARTVARLKRGWIGVYVTTSFYSEPVQREVIEDEYPIILINGKKLAETVQKILHDEGYSSLEKYLTSIDLIYGNRIQVRRPEELIFI